MIYIKNQSSAQSLSVPVEGTAAKRSSYVLRLVDTADNGTLDLTATASSDSNPFYYGVSVTLPSGTKAGEYVYKLGYMSGTSFVVLAQGLASIGTSTDHTATEYAATEANYKIYGE